MATISKFDDPIYRAWRRREAYAVPMTDEGVKRAEDRYREFAIGFEAGLREAAYVLEEMHRENKDTHKFYLIASRAVRELYRRNLML